jgi:hypothetical protein
VALFFGITFPPCSSFVSLFGASMADPPLLAPNVREC